MTRRNVFLLNTHLNHFINDSKWFLGFLEEIIEEFQNDRDSVLWWRPHPLSIQTFQSMGLAYLERYLRIVDEVREMENGIYDDTPDLYRAIDGSDAYIGSVGSSLVPLYYATGKPMWLIKQDRVPCYNTAVTRVGMVADKEFFFSLYEYNGLFKLDIEDGQISYLGDFPLETNLSGSIHCYAYVYQKICFFIPEYGEYITAFNLVTYEMEKIIIPWFRERPYELKFRKGIAQGRYLWLVPIKASVIARLDMQSGTLTEYSDWPESLVYNERAGQFLDGMLADNILCLCPFAGNPWVCLNTDTGKMTAYAASFPGGSYGAIEYDGRFAWCFPFNADSILKFDVQLNQYEEVTDFPDGYKKGDKGFLTCVKVKDDIWGFPYNANMIIKIDGKSNQMIGYNYEENMFFCDRAHRIYGDFHKVVVSEGSIWAMSIYGRGILEINPSTGESKIHGLEITEQLYKKSVNKVRGRGLGAYQGGPLEGAESNCIIPLRWFMDEVHSRQLGKRENKRQDIQPSGFDVEGAGTRIWETVLRQHQNNRKAAIGYTE